MTIPPNTELRIQTNTSRKVSLLSGNLISNVRTRSSGVSARTLRGGVYGFASDADTSPQAVAAVIKAAAENAEFLEGRAKIPPKTMPHVPPVTLRRDADNTDTQQKEYLDFARELDDYIAKKHPDLSGRTIAVSADSMEKHLRTDFGTQSYSLTPRCYAYVFLTMNTKDGATVELYDVYGRGGTLHEVFSSPAELFPKIDELYTQLCKKAEGVFPDAGSHICVLHPNLAGMLAHEAVGHTCEADFVQSGSVAADNLHKRVASNLVTMIDFAHTLPDGTTAPLPIFCDDEGVAAQDAVLIKDGYLTGYMHSRETARLYGHAPTGSARAYAYSDEPLIRMRNTAILPGKDKLEDMIASVDRGYYFTETNNGQADTTGEFMFGVCMGYEIVNGKIARALRDTTISGVAFEMLQSVDMLSQDFVWVSSGYCGKKQIMPVSMGGPALRCRVNVGGR
ncbi:MAG: TldD/PmbA family protein [Oscillospiraceae bacterium]|nr:TldD/PmbA family protein [Oscillospiraceae bacterium]